MTKNKSDNKEIEQYKAANELLGMIRQQGLPHVENFAFNSRLEVRSVNEEEPFKALTSTDETEQTLIGASDARIMMTTRLEEGSPRFRVYLFGDVIAYNDRLYGECVEAIVNRTFSTALLDTPAGIKQSIPKKVTEEDL